MKKILKIINIFGFNPKQLYLSITSIPWFIKSFIKFKRTQPENNNDFSFRFLPIFNDRFESSGSLSGHYFHQDLLIAQKIFANKPTNHLDIGSSIYGFVSHVASFRKIDIVDIRDNISHSKNIFFRKFDLLNLDKKFIDYYDSISCLHVIEHFGLGRYNDNIDFNGHIKGLENIAKIIKKDGIFYLGTPVGKPKIYFNAHRVFNAHYIFRLLSPYFDLLEFHFINDEGILLNDLDFSKFDCDQYNYGCGIFILKRKI